MYKFKKDIKRFKIDHKCKFTGILENEVNQTIFGSSGSVPTSP